MPNFQLSTPHAPIEKREIRNPLVGKGLAPSGGEMLQIYTVFRRIRNIFRIRIGFLVICWHLLPEGASPFPTVPLENLADYPGIVPYRKPVPAARLGSRALRKEPGFSRLFRYVQKAEAF